eukprot:UN26469
MRKYREWIDVMYPLPLCDITSRFEKMSGKRPVQEELQRLRDVRDGFRPGDEPVGDAELNGQSTFVGFEEPQKEQPAAVSMTQHVRQEEEDFAAQFGIEEEQEMLRAMEEQEMAQQATVQPPAVKSTLTDEQRLRMEEKKRLAKERRLARQKKKAEEAALKQQNQNNDPNR